MSDYVTIVDRTREALAKIGSLEDKRLRKLANTMQRYAIKAGRVSVRKKGPKGGVRWELVKGDTESGGAPRRTGNLARSIEVEKVGDRFYKIQTQTRYGAWVELGTAHMPGNPFMRRAFQAAVKDVLGGEAAAGVSSGVSV